MISHPIAPVFDGTSRILILGSFPSVRSREAGFFYGHPQNRFWRVLAAVFEVPVPQTVEEKRALLIARHIALWDVIAACDVAGSADSSIRHALPNDLSLILSAAPVERIFVNGKTAQTCFRRYTEPLIHRPAVCLPSTSPANAAWSLDRLIGAWSVLRNDEALGMAPLRKNSEND